jgi:hypothetical protein
MLLLVYLHAVGMYLVNLGKRDINETRYLIIQVKVD